MDGILEKLKKNLADKSKVHGSTKVQTANELSKPLTAKRKNGKVQKFTEGSKRAEKNEMTTANEI